MSYKGGAEYGNRWRKVKCGRRGISDGQSGKCKMSDGSKWNT